MSVRAQLRGPRLARLVLAVTRAANGSWRICEKVSIFAVSRRPGDRTWNDLLGQRAECSIDGSDWEAIFSEDRIVDSKVEEFEVKTDDLIVGEHAVALRVFDSAGNVTIGKAVVSIK